MGLWKRKQARTSKEDKESVVDGGLEKCSKMKQRRRSSSQRGRGVAEPQTAVPIVTSDEANADSSSVESAINEVRGGVKNPFYDHSDYCKPLESDEKLFYYAITYPVAVTRLFFAILSILIYLIFLMLLFPLIMVLRKRALSQCKDEGLTRRERIERGHSDTCNILYNLILKWPGELCGLFVMLSIGYKVIFRGLENLQNARTSKKAFVCVSNHVSYFDVGAICYLLGPFSAVAKADIANIPVIGWVANAWGTFYVNRQSRTRTESEQLNADLKERAETMGPFFMQPPLLVFPEGTTTSGEAITQFRLGAFRPGTSILPIVLKYDCKSKLRSGWAPPYDGQEHLFRLAATWNKSLTITILPLHTPAHSETPEQTARLIQGKMADSIGVPAAYEWSLKDAIALFKCIYKNYGAKEKKAGERQSMKKES